MPRLIRFLLLASATVPLFAQTSTPINLSGIVTDSAGAPISAAAIRLENGNLAATSGADGKFTITGGTSLRFTAQQPSFASIRNGLLLLSLPEKGELAITAYGISGEEISSLRKPMDAGSFELNLPNLGTGVRFFKVTSGRNETMLKAYAVDGALRNTLVSPEDLARQPLLAKQAAAAAAAYYDVVTSTKTGYQKAYVSISASDATGITIKMLKEGSAKFSFFVTSMAAMQDLADTVAGFGGDYRFGETGPGAGLRGADKICATIAERSMKGSSVKGWRAFLSVTADAYGKQVDAISRVGEGPWYDRTGRLLAPTKADLLAVRPKNGDPSIQNDIPNENGIPNHRPDPSKPQDDNHHTVTGSNETGKLKSATATCKDWTTSVGSSANGQPSCGFAWPRGGAGSTGSGSNWITTWDAPGCAAGIDVASSGGAPPGSIIIGGGGGYGAFYCFALNP
jgi:hypothetical protein